jgi:hypothetical protein
MAHRFHAVMSAWKRSKPTKGVTMKVLRNAAIELEATTEAVLAAHEAYGRYALESVGWERRGPLRRLVRVDAPESEDKASDDSIAA